jgi:hypothetical protein
MFLTALWLPIIVSAVVLFLMSSVAWTMLPHHNRDYSGMPDEGAQMATLRIWNLAPGRYLIPYAGSHKNARSEDFQKKWKEGPNGSLTIFAPLNMGRNLGLTFLFFLTTSSVLAYLGWVALGTSAEFMHVFRVMGTAGVLTFTAASVPNDIWFRRPLLTNLIDGIAYGVVCGLIFASLWPS